MDTSQAGLFKHALVGAVINGVINAVISGFTFFKHDSVPITLDHISNHEVTVFGQGVMLALVLSLILTGIEYKMFSQRLRKANAGLRIEVFH